MSFAVRFIVLSIFVALAFSGATGTFGTPLKKASSTSTVTTASNGITVVITGGGWIIGDALTLTTTAGITWSTVVAATGSTGVGLVAVSTCTTAVTAATTTLAGRVSQACPSDFATYYNSAPATTSTSAISPTSSAVPVGTAVEWLLKAPSTPGSTQAIGVDVKIGTAAQQTIIDSTAGTASGSTAQQAAKSNFGYAFYVETGTTDATVCFQTDAQHTTSPLCDYTASTTSSSSSTAKSAAILSATITGFVAMIALIFFS